jgi:hypothetical protein
LLLQSSFNNDLSIIISSMSGSQSNEPPRQHHQPNNNQNPHPNPTFLQGRPTPRYIRSITIQNKSSGKLEAKTKHKSGKESVWEVSPNSSLKIEEMVQKESYSCVDAVTCMCVKGGNGGQQILTADDSDAQGV